MQDPIFILSAPSGGGKSTVAKVLTKKVPSLERVVTATTRKRRMYEKQGKDYLFLRREVFQAYIKQEKFLEWANVHNEFYGVPKRSIANITAGGKVPLLIVDVQGEKKIKKILPSAISIFLRPESFTALKRWLGKSGRGGEKEMRIRLKNARKELKQAFRYDYRVTNRNGRLKETIALVASIIQSHIDKARRSK